MTSKLKKILIFLCVTALVVCSVFASNLVSADNEVIVNDVNPSLKKEVIGDGLPWATQTEYSENGGKYTIKTNAYVIWYEEDDFDYFYKHYAFNYHKKAVLTAETKVESWEMARSTSSAGIVIRSSLKPEASSVFFHIRQTGICAIYRSADSAWSKVVYTQVSSYPVQLRVELTKNVVYCYYKVATSDKWVKLNATIPFTYSESVYVGLGAHSAEQTAMSTAVFDGFNVKVEVPAGLGIEPVEPGQGSGGSGPVEEEEEKIELPEDIVDLNDKNLLLYESFTDGNLFPDKATVTDPIWSTNNPEPNVVVNEDKTNRYMHLEMENKNYYYTGDEDNWYDYSASFDINFSEASAPSERNIFDLYVRRRFSLFNGVFYYGVRFETNVNTGEGTVSIITDEYAKVGDEPQVAAEKSIVIEDGVEKEVAVAKTTPLNYISKGFAGVTHTVRIDAFDNVITVYLDDMTTPILQYKDENSATFKGNGGVGFYSDSAVVSVDNIIVRKLDDPVGGNYDNEINGNFDVPIPEFVDTFSKNGWEY